MKRKAIEAIEDLKKYRNYSLYRAIKLSNLDRMNNVAIEYRKNKITYKEMFEMADRYASSLKAMGYGHGSEIVACVSNSPEFIYLLLAASKIGAKFNTVGEWFGEDYLNEIITKSGKRRIFMSDDNYEALRGKLKRTKAVDEIVMFSLNDSLPIFNGVKKDPFAEIDDNFKSFDYKVAKYKQQKASILSQDEFLHKGTEYCKNNSVVPYFIEEPFDLEDEFLITYTSGSTNENRPKATKHSVKALSILSRFKESDVSGMPEMKDIRVYAHIPSYVLANISTSIIDPLYLGCTVIPEPIYDKEYFPYGIILNEPNMSGGSVSFWRNLCMKFLNSEIFKKRSLPYLFLPIVTGEAMSSGEEKFFNKMARKHKFGVGKLPWPLAPVTFSIGGGTNEITGIFVTLFRRFQEKYLGFGKKVGQTPLACADVEVVNKNGKPVDVGEFGEIIVRTECGMKGYRYDSDLNKSVMFKRNGEDWYRMSAYGVKLDNLPHIQIKGRLKDHIIIKDDEGNLVEYPLFLIDDIVAADTKNILSSSVIKTEVGGDEVIVIHIEPQVDAVIKDKDKLMQSICSRLEGKIPTYLTKRIFIRFRSNDESFPIDPSGKRSIRRLQEEKLYRAKSFYDIKYHEMFMAKTLSMKEKK